MLEHAHAAGDRDQEGGRPAEQQQSIGAFDRADQAPFVVEHDIAIADGGEAGGREVEGCFEVFHRTDSDIGQRVEPDLDGVDADQAKHDDQDHCTLAGRALVWPEAMAAAAQEPQQAEQTAEMDGDGEADHEGRECEGEEH